MGKPIVLILSKNFKLSKIASNKFKEFEKMTFNKKTLLSNLSKCLKSFSNSNSNFVKIIIHYFKICFENKFLNKKIKISQSTLSLI